MASPSAAGQPALPASACLFHLGGAQGPSLRSREIRGLSSLALCTHPRPCSSGLGSRFLPSSENPAQCQELQTQKT